MFGKAISAANVVSYGSTEPVDWISKTLMRNVTVRRHRTDPRTELAAFCNRFWVMLRGKPSATTCEGSADGAHFTRPP